MNVTSARLRAAAPPKGRSPVWVPLVPIGLSMVFLAALVHYHLAYAGRAEASNTFQHMVAGLYGWWFDHVPACVPLDGVTVRDEWRLLYVGIAPSRSGGRATLRSRIGRNHLGRRASASTLRRTLGCLLAADLGLTATRTSPGKYTFGEGEDALTRWMQKHARVSWVATDSPWSVESAVIESLTLPLNIEFNSSHPFCAELKRMRRLMMANASALTLSRGCPGLCAATPSAARRPVVGEQ